MGNWAYLSVDNLKTDLGITATTHDTVLRRMLETVSEQIDSYCERTFRVWKGVQYLTTNDRRYCRLDSDLLSVTTLKTLSGNDTGTRTYGTTWATTDYDLLPDNAAALRRPYTTIAANPGGRYWFPNDRRGVEVTGTWGFRQELETPANQLASGMSSSTESVSVTSIASFDVCDTLLIDDEQVYVYAIYSDTTSLGVVRGVNGTTAAAHAGTATVRIYRYPSPITTACGIHAARMFNRARNSPQGVAGSSDMGIVRPVRLDADVKALIEEYRAGLA